ncbi:hypothetical protein KC957_00910 [Candidatus Saccharibacteria bacterium]|nr:hypothetical protein [Candidatus Saccharibacteria bacterium]
MSSQSEQPVSAQEQLAVVVDILASTAERIQLLHGAVIGPVLVNPIRGFSPEAMGQLTRDTISTASELIGRLGGISLAYQDDKTGQQSRHIAYSINSYDPAHDLWEFMANPHGMLPEPGAFVEVRCTTPELRTAYLMGRLQDAPYIPLHPREP